MTLKMVRNNVVIQLWVSYIKQEDKNNNNNNHK